MDIRGILIPDRRPDPGERRERGALQPNLMLGRLYDSSNHIVGGIVYEDDMKTRSIDRKFVCVKQGMGYLSLINQGFEEGIKPRPGPGPITIKLMANVTHGDPERKVYQAHWKEGYKPNVRNVNRLLVGNPGFIPMKRELGAPLPPPEEVAAMKAKHMKEVIDVRNANKARKATLRPNFLAGRRRKRFSTRRNKRYNGRPVRRCSRRR